MKVVLWRDESVKSITHRVIWWLLDVGAPGHILQRGWVIACSREMKLSRITVARQVSVMVDSGLLIECKQGVYLNLDIFGKCADRSLVRMMKRGQK